MGGVTSYYYGSAPAVQCHVKVILALPNGKITYLFDNVLDTTKISKTAGKDSEVKFEVNSETGAMSLITATGSSLVGQDGDFGSLRKALEALVVRVDAQLKGEDLAAIEETYAFEIQGTSPDAKIVYRLTSDQAMVSRTVEGAQFKVDAKTGAMYLVKDETLGEEAGSDGDVEHFRNYLGSWVAKFRSLLE